MPNNNRSFTRVALNLGVEVESEVEPAFLAKAQDLSLKGVYVITDHGMGLDSKCHLTLFPESGTGISKIVVEGRVARPAHDGLGIEFTSITTSEFHHLRDLLSILASNDTAIDQEYTQQLKAERRDISLIF